MTTVDVYARAYPEADMNSAPTYKVVVKEGATVTGPDMVVGGQGSVSGKLIPSKTTLFGLKGLLVRLDYDWSNMTTADADGRLGLPPSIRASTG